MKLGTNIFVFLLSVKNISWDVIGVLLRIKYKNPNKGPMSSQMTLMQIETNKFVFNIIKKITLLMQIETNKFVFNIIKSLCFSITSEYWVFISSLTTVSYNPTANNCNYRQWGGGKGGGSLSNYHYWQRWWWYTASHHQPSKCI